MVNRIDNESETPEEGEPVEPLTDAERKCLAECEETIQDGMFKIADMLKPFLAIADPEERWQTWKRAVESSNCIPAPLVAEFLDRDFFADAIRIAERYSKKSL